MPLPTINSLANDKLITIFLTIKAVGVTYMLQDRTHNKTMLLAIQKTKLNFLSKTELPKDGILISLTLR